MHKLALIYGPVVGFYVGPRRPFVSVCGYEAIKEALHNQDLDGRPANFRQSLQDNAHKADKLGMS